MAGFTRQSRAFARRRAPVAVPLALASLLAATAAPAAPGPPPPTAQPNIVVVMSDDQDTASMIGMPKTGKLIGSRGTTFTNSIATNPVCCPSRSTYLTGQYSHTTGVFRNSPPHGGFADFDDSETLPVWLQRAGYETALIGKYMNGYGFTEPTRIPRGWSWWQGLLDPTTYRMYGYRINENGTVVDYGEYDDPDPAIYQTDVLAAKAVEFVDRQAEAGSGRPFFMTVSPLAPHTEVYARPHPGDDDAATPTHPNPRPAPRHLDVYANATLPRDPNFNERNVSDKPAMVRARRTIGPALRETVTQRYRARMGSLLAVDDMVASIVSALRRNGQLENTIFVYTSDNGFQRGQHRIPFGKQMPYEESLQVPLLVRGPGVPRGAVRTQMVGNVDLAPTIAAWAGVDPGRTSEGTSRVDGTAIAPLLESRRRELGRALVIENWCQTNETCFDPELPRFRGLRTDRFSYVAYPNGEQELYDMARDPWQLKSRHRDPRYSANLRALRRLLGQMQECSGAACLSRPRVKVGVNAGFGRLGGGKRCTASAVTVRLRGAQRGSAMELESTLRGRQHLDKTKPLRLRVGRSALKRRGATKLHLRVTVLDGRVIAKTRRIPRPC